MGCRGCLTTILVVLGLLTLLVLGGLGFAFVEARQIGKRMEAARGPLAALDEAHPFEPPADGRVPPERFEAYLRARADAASVTARIVDLVERIDAIDEHSGVVNTVRLAFQAMREIPKLYAETLERLGQALAEEEMSYREYRWITLALHAALRSGAADGDHGSARDLHARVRSIVDERRDAEGRERGFSFDSERFDRAVEDFGEATPANLDLLLEHEEAWFSPAKVVADLVVLNQSQRSG